MSTLLLKAAKFAASIAPVLFAANASAQPYSYSGGAVVQSPRVAVVHWGTQAPGAGMALNQFYGELFNSPYFDRLSEYGVSVRPTFIGSFDIHQGDSISIDTIAIARGIDEAVLARVLPMPDDNTIYMVHFGSSMTPVMGTNIAGQTVGASVGTGFCAYHFTARTQMPLAPPFLFAYGPKLRIAVIPEASSIAGCSSGTSLDTSTFMATHELVETITDPDSIVVAMRPVIGETLQCDRIVLPPTGEAANAVWAWTSSKSKICNPDEIADSCSSGQFYKTAAGEYFVSKLFQNSASACTEAAAMPAPLPPETPRQACIKQCSAERASCLEVAHGGAARGACVRSYLDCSDSCPP